MSYSSGNPEYQLHERHRDDSDLYNMFVKRLVPYTKPTSTQAVNLPSQAVSLSIDIKSLMTNDFHGRTNVERQNTRQHELQVEINWLCDFLMDGGERDLQRMKG